MSYLITTSEQDSHQTAPHPMLVVIPFVNRNTKDMKTDSIKDALATRKPILVVSDILSVTVNSNKGDPQMTAEVALSSGDLNYMAEFAPGDHALIWLVNNRESFDKIANEILAQQPANGYFSGLKMIGRVNSVRQILNTTPEGKKTFRYLVTIKGFYEFTTQVYYNPLLADSPDATLAKKFEVFAQLDSSWKDLFSKKGVANVGKILAFFIDSFFGSGPSSAFTGQAVGQPISPNRAFLVPNSLCRLLGVKLKSPKAAANKYADLLQVMIGVQKYTASSKSERIASFIPSNLEKNPSQGNFQNKLYTNVELKGSTVAPPSNFNNVTMWSLLQSHANTALNEMYCTLKPVPKNNGRGEQSYALLPTFVARQVPFTTHNYPDKKGTTEFLNLPRWKLADNYPVMNYNIGNSDVGRFNFWQIYVSTPELQDNPQLDMHQQLRGNTDIDQLDIARNGPRIFTAQTNAGTISSDGQTVSGVQEWRDLVVDWYKNLHYKATGSITVAGVQAPIAVGDNFEFDGKLFHIESVSHSYSVAPNGMKSFLTTIGLSHGVLTSGAFFHQEEKTRRSLSGNEHLPGYTDEEVYVNDHIIVSNDGTVLADSNESAPSSAADEVKGAILNKVANLRKGLLP